MSRSFTSKKKRLFRTYVKRHLLLPKENELLVFKYTVVWNVANIRGPFRPLTSHSCSVYTGQMRAKLVAPLGFPVLTASESKQTI